MTVLKRARSSNLPEFSKARQWLSHSGSSPLSSDMTSAPALKGKASIKHRKNCECCPVSLLMVRSQRLSEFRFSIVRIISVSNVASLQDCLCNCQNGKNNCLNCLNCQKCQKCQKCFLLTPYLSSCPTFQGDHLSPAMWSAVRPEAVVWLMKVERMSLSKILLRSKASSSFSELMSAIRRSAILGSFPSVCFRTTARTHMPYGHLAEKYSPQDSSLQEKHGRREYNITTSWKISIEYVGGKVYNRHMATSGETLL